MGLNQMKSKAIAEHNERKLHKDTKFPIPYTFLLWFTFKQGNKCIDAHSGSLVSTQLTFWNHVRISLLGDIKMSHLWHIINQHSLHFITQCAPHSCGLFTCICFQTFVAIYIIVVLINHQQLPETKRFTKPGPEATDRMN